MKQTSWIVLVAGAAFSVFAETWSAKSPDGKNEIRLTSDNGLQVVVLRNGRTRIAPTTIGMTFAGREPFAGKGAGRAKTATKRATIETPLYKKAKIEQNANETTVSFADGYAVALYADKDGVAYRFETSVGGTVKVADERMDLAFTGPEQTAYVGYSKGGDPLQSSWESIYQKTPVSKIEAGKNCLVYLPLLLTDTDGASTVVTESDLRGYPGLNFFRPEGGSAKLSARLAPYPVLSKVTDNQRQRHVHERENWLAETDGTRVFPWRVFILTDKPAELFATDIVYALATPNMLDDTSWIKPGKVAWDWWNNWNISHVNFRAGVNTATYQYYIDFAKKNRIEYVIFDEGWSVHLKILEINPDVDVPGLIQYGKERGVGIILWCAWSQLVGRQEEIFKKYAEMGAKGFKIDFMDRDDAFVVDFLEKTAVVAAKYKLLVDYHGMYKPTGMQRAYPNIINFEGVHGLEQLKWEKGDAFPENDCKIVFTRMIAGPLDYTPGSMINQTKSEYAPCNAKPTSQGTRCHQMALMTMLEAPLQMLCDSPSRYIANQECTDFMAAVPTVWDETVGLAGEVGKYAALARRKGEDWYISAICNWNGAELTLDTSFLAGKKYKAEIFADGINADRDATDYTRVFTTVTGGKPLTIKMFPGGGWTARLTRQ